MPSRASDEAKYGPSSTRPKKKPKPSSGGRPKPSGTTASGKANLGGGLAGTKGSGTAKVGTSSGTTAVAPPTYSPAPVYTGPAPRSPVERPQSLTAQLVALASPIDARPKLALPGKVIDTALDQIAQADTPKPRISETGPKTKPAKVDPMLIIESALKKLAPAAEIKETDRGKVVTGFRVKGKKPGKTSTQPVFGKPTVRQLAEGAEAGKLGVTRKGRVGTKQQFKAAKNLKGARQGYRTAKEAAKGAPRRELMSAGLTAEQAKVLAKVLKVGDQMGATQKEKLSAVQTALVEANISNPLVATDHDSLGWRQERQMYYDNPTNIRASAKRYFEETAAAGRGAGTSPGTLAQSVQRSAFPERYDERTAEAQPLLEAYDRAPMKAIPADVRQALQKAKAQGVKLGIPNAEVSAATQSVGVDLGKAPKQTVTRFKAGMAAAMQLEKLSLPYLWGGGHVSGEISPGAGLDCSGAVSYVAQAMGFMKEGALVSGDFGSVTEPGPGAVTVFYNPGHIIMKIGNKYFGTSKTNPEGGAGFLDKSVGDSMAQSSEYSVGHFPGMGQKVAQQMGLDPGESANFPGMSVDGSTATIIPGAGVQAGSPGFSDSPIAADTDRASSGAGSYSGGISSSNLPQAYMDLIMGAGATPGETGVLDEFLTDRKRS